MTGGLAQAAMNWYAGAARDLPWRRPRAGPWPVLVSEVMLQQTPVVRVLPAYDAWIARWPTPGSLAVEPPGEAIRQWGRLGYPRRALRLHAAAVAIVDRHEGRVPDSLPDLLALPGVGGYTARAVAAFAFGQRHAVVDTNVRRVLARALGGEAVAGAWTTSADLRRAESVLPIDPASAGRAAVAVMEIGALVCTARTPSCHRCPLASRCRWYAAGRPAAAGPSRRRRQGYAGTDREVRGLVLAALRQGRSRCRSSTSHRAGRTPGSCPGPSPGWWPTGWPGATVPTGWVCRAEAVRMASHGRDTGRDRRRRHRSPRNAHPADRHRHRER